MSTLELNIEGMNCNHCVRSIRNELGRIPGVTVEAVEIGKVRITIEDERVSRQSIESAVTRAGYSLKGIG